VKYTAGELIRSRKEKWQQTKSIDMDRRLRNAIAARLMEDPELLQEVREKPEKLIELVFVVVDKGQKLMPFFLNDVQKDFMERVNKAKQDFADGLIPEISILVLKGRQQGFTTLVTAYQLACCILNPNFQGFSLADNSDNSASIFQNKAKFPYAQLPDALKPTEKLNNRKQLLFSKLNSSWSVDTATKDVGRSRTVNFFHGSECAFWRDGIARIQAALGEAFTKNCVKIYESTANGFNDYEAMWSSGAHVTCFYEWWRTPEYRLSFRNAEMMAEFLQKIGRGTDWIWERLRWLKDEKHLEPEQLFWYWNKYDKLLEKDLIRQEYPCTPREAFLLSGKNVFDTEALVRAIEAAPKPLKTGYFEYDYDGLTIRNIRFVRDRNGYIRIYRKPNTPAVTSYAIGGDTAGLGSDSYTGHVLDAATGQQVAVLRHQLDADQYAKQMYCLGKYYGDALIGIEANFDSYPIMELQRLGYDNQYVREVQDTYTGRTEKRFGFLTTSLTRPTAISRLVEIVREHCDTIVDRETLDELMTITRNEKGRIEAPQGGHDDHMMGLAIAHQVREQVVLSENVISQGDGWRRFRMAPEREAQYERGSAVEII
jgi:hypothetical protein